MEEGWPTVYNGILKLRSRLEEGALLDVLPVEECMMLYTTIYNLQGYNEELYDKYRDSIKEYIASVVLPALNRIQCNELMLRELVRRWGIYKVMVRYMSKFFHHLEIHFIRNRSLPTLREVGLLFFHDMVYDHEMRINLKNALMTLIRQEREGQRIDGALVKNVLAIFEEIRMPGAIMDFYTNDFETAVFEGVGACYSEKAALWILEDSCTDYLLKVEESLKCEDRVAHYLHSISQQKLLEIVQTELLSRYQTRLLENEHSGCLALLREYRKDDLLRMCRLFCRIPNGLEPIANIFKSFVISEGTSLVKLAEDAVRDKKKDLDGIQERVAYVGTIVELHDKYMKYVADALQRSTFLYALQKHL
jgi:cullin 1